MYFHIVAFIFENLNDNWNKCKLMKKYNDCIIGKKLNYQVSIFNRHDSLHDFIDRNIFQQIIHMRLKYNLFDEMTSLRHSSCVSHVINGMT